MTSKMRSAAASLLIGVSAPIAIPQTALAQEDAASAAEGSKEDKQLDFFSSLFTSLDDDNAEPIAEEQLSLARITTNKILPEGTYGRAMEKTFDQMLAPLAALFAEISPLEIAQVTGVDEEGLYDLSAEDRGKIADIIDPRRAERGQRTLDIMLPIMKEASTAIEPALREGMSRAYARKFSAKQLNELNAFFDTPTGSFYASESFILLADPEITRASLKAIPTIMEKVLEIVPTLDEAMKDAPQARTLADLDSKELKNLAGLLSVKTSELEDYRDNPPEEEDAPITDKEIEDALEHGQDNAGHGDTDHDGHVH